MKIFCYGMQKPEIEIFKKSNEKYNFELSFTNDLLTEENMKVLPEGTDAVILFVNCNASKKVLEFYKSKGVKYVVTRTAGFDHVDLKAASDLGYIVGRVPAYSPTAVASLAFADGVSLIRKNAYMFDQTRNGNFKVDENMFAREFSNLTIGILGTGRIGYEAAKYWKGVGAKVIGYDLYPNKHAEEVLTYVTQDELIKQSDLVSIHVPYFKGQNDNLINKDFISKMKPMSSIVNVSRAPLVNLKDAVEAIKANKIFGYACDVFDNESSLINKQLTMDAIKKLNPTLEEAISLYPRLLISPHVAYFTDEAVKNMADISFKNLDELIKTGTCETALNPVQK
ncbi:NAD(P)-dependent oxidoreductase [Williamsoniiplasma lucivorax]|uniref:Lactate dehydrogenase n=1 Tax=Williamsoniiplasma lucivorax TaxID=209274 RepID=A0A2S5RA09_9MOLU|nr:NAD(P)-dependent oxidoreductase [Williamsoniiplasma lucivorax]PPE04137.1 lactate dehydrogenase [Williamsoniiplasma lucivorax]